MIVGNDVSQFQNQIDWNTYKDNTNFVFIKLSEGGSYIDKWAGYNRQQARSLNIPRGYYHLGRYDLGNTPQQDAQFFINLINGDPIQVGENISLDCEYSFPGLVDWVKQWCDIVSAQFNGIKIWVYLNQSLAKRYDWTPVIQAGHKLWGAGYTYDPNNETGLDFGQWSSPSLRQWENNEDVPGITGYVDADEFDGSIQDFINCGYQLPVQPAPVSEVVTTPTEIPITVTTSADNVSIVPSSTPSTESATPSAEQVNSTSIVQPQPLPKLTLPQMSLIDNIVFILLRIKNVLSKIWKRIN